MKLLTAALLFLSSLLSPAQSPKSELPAHPRLKVAIDPGHGGDDTGALSAHRIRECDLVLSLGKALGAALREAGYDVMFTREGDTFRSFPERAKAANDAGADIFVSLHLNAARARKAKGSEVFFLSLDQGDADAAEVAALENAAERKTATADDLVNSILDDLAQKAFLQDSQRLAVAIQMELNRLGGIKQRGVKQAPFAVLRRAAMPAALVETVFISNPKEEAKIKDPAFRQRAAAAIARGISGFFADGSRTARRKAFEGNAAKPVGASR